MISSKYITRLSVILMSAVLLLCFLAIGYSDQIAVFTQTNGIQMEYPTVLFDHNQVTDIRISMPQEKWNEMLSDATAEEYFECQVTVGGKTFYQVGIRPKGNTSLSSVAMDPDNNRYSFKLEFDHFVDGQTCFGLDKLALNNSYADSTNMKEALLYDMFQFLDADAPLYNFAKITVNGEYWGVYLALEAVEDSFMMRNYGMETGRLYKPDNMNRDPNENGGGGFGRGGGANLNYTDDSLDSYSSIWYGAVNDNKESDRKRVVEALKAISEGKDIEQYMDVDNLLRYMAVHNFSVNEDSLSGMMAHNYYLYEANGKLNIIPWDYNLSFGGMGGMGGGRGGEGATSVINEPIDDTYQGTRFFDYLLKNEEYKQRYHEYYQRLITEYFEDGKFDETFERIRSQIDELVKEDPNQMYSYEEYKKGADTLYQVMMLRAESVSGQLAGNIPTTSSEQYGKENTLIDGSTINLSDMGSFMGGGPKR